jgi:hypothetical protein
MAHVLEIDIDLIDFTDEELIEECQDRGILLEINSGIQAIIGLLEEKGCPWPLLQHLRDWAGEPVPDLPKLAKWCEWAVGTTE